MQNENLAVESTRHTNSTTIRVRHDRIRSIGRRSTASPTGRSPTCTPHAGSTTTCVEKDTTRTETRASSIIAAYELFRETPSSSLTLTSQIRIGSQHRTSHITPMIAKPRIRCNLSTLRPLLYRMAPPRRSTRHGPWTTHPPRPSSYHHLILIHRRLSVPSSSPRLAHRRAAGGQSPGLAAAPPSPPPRRARPVSPHAAPGSRTPMASRSRRCRCCRARRCRKRRGSL